MAALPDPLAARVLRCFRAQVEDWHDMCRLLSAWEDRHLLDSPTPERLAEHAETLGELERVGRWLASAAQSPDYPDRETAELVAMTLQDLKDRRAMWHSQVRKEEAEDIVRTCFP